MFCQNPNIDDMNTGIWPTQLPIHHAMTASKDSLPFHDYVFCPGTKQNYPDSSFHHQSQRLRGTDQQISLSTCSPYQIPNSKSVLGKDQDIAQLLNVRPFAHDHQ
jgi:hypothetical protein